MKSTNELTVSRKPAVLNRVVRLLFAAPLMLCVLLGFAVSLPLWLVSRVLGILGFDRSY